MQPDDVRDGANVKEDILGSVKEKARKYGLSQEPQHAKSTAHARS